jgi:hypothetical protein
MPTNPKTEQSHETPKAPKPASGELDSGALDKVTGGMKQTGFKGTKTADPCEGGE